MPVFVHPVSSLFTTSFCTTVLIELLALCKFSNTNVIEINTIRAIVMYGKSEGAIADNDRPNSSLGAATSIGMASKAAAAVNPATPANSISFC